MTESAAPVRVIEETPAYWRVVFDYPPFNIMDATLFDVLQGLLGGNPVLRRLKDNEEIRPLSANRNTIKAMERRGLITPGKGRDLLTIVWRLKKR